MSASDEPIGPQPLVLDKTQCHNDVASTSNDTLQEVKSHGLDNKTEQTSADLNSRSSSQQSGAIPQQSDEIDSKAWKSQAQVIPDNNLPIVFTGLTCTIFLAALDQTIVACALPTISRDLGGSSMAYGWVGTAYLLMSTCCSPFYGKISNIVGRKPVLFAAIGLFLLGSLLCGLAQNMIWLCAARGLQGMGGGGIIQLCQIIVSDVVPLSKRGRYSGLIGMCWALASACGGAIGGALTIHASWRWCFFINLPTGGVAAAILFFFLNLNPAQGQTFKQFVSTFDFVGLALLMGGTAILLVGFSFAERSWSSPQTITLLVVGICTLIVAAYQEITTKRSQIIPPRLFKTRTPALILISTMLHSFAFIALSFYLPVYFQVLGADALLAGVKFMPYSLGGALVSIASGFLISYIKRTREIMAVSFLIATLGYGLIASLDENSGLAKQIIYMLVASLGIGPLFQSPYISIQAAVPIGDMATSTSTIGLVRSLGGTIGLSISSSIYASELLKRLEGTGFGVGEEMLTGQVDGLNELQPLAYRHEIQHAFSRAINTCWIVCAPLLFVGFLLCLPMKHYSLDRKVVKAGVQGEAEETSNATTVVVESDKEKV
ncbi:hypothetical protein OIO90_002724 [Microbotryomycetes sp. JL221]|nr:hypothetical protein OIO90_002724 [Microbotryomycetes sp. JL221]